MSDLMDRIIADLVEGARRSEGFIRGGRASVEVARENRGRESKLANHTALGAGLGAGMFEHLGSRMGIPLAGPAAAALSATTNGGSAFGAGTGSLLGGGMGGYAGAGLAELLHMNPGTGSEIGRVLGSGLGAAAGATRRDESKLAMFGTAGGGMSGLLSPHEAGAHMVNSMKPAARVPRPAPAAGPAAGPSPFRPPGGPSPFAAPPKMAEEFERGVKAACVAFGVKEAFLPAAMAAGRALLPAAKAVGNFATKNPIGQQMAGTAGSMAVQRAMTPQQPG